MEDQEDEYVLADCILRLLADPSLRARKGAAGLKRAREEFSWEHVGAAFEELLVNAATEFRKRKVETT